MSSTARSPRPTHFRAALAHALSPAAWRHALGMRDADATVAVAVRVGIATLIALVGGGLLGYREVAGFAALGALCSAFQRYAPYRTLAPTLACIGLGTVGYAAFGAVLGALGISIWPQILLLSLAAGAVYWVFVAFEITGPGPVILIFAAAGAAGFADTAADVGLVAAATAVGAVVGWLVALSPMLYHRHGPARIAVARALSAVAGSASDTDAARAAIARARFVLAHDTGRRTDPHTRDLSALVDAAESVLDAGEVEKRRDDLLRVDAQLRRVRRVVELPQLDTVDVKIIDTSESALRVGLRNMRERAVLIGVGRVVAASLLSGWLAAGLGMDHPLWATMGAMAVLQGMNYRHTVQRAIQRLLGNVFGAGLAAVVLVLEPGFWSMVAAIVVCQTITEIFVTRNYGLASVFVTAMALLITAIGSTAGPEIAASRVVDTLIGVVVGVVVAALTIARGDHHHLVPVGQA